MALTGIVSRKQVDIEEDPAVMCPGLLRTSLRLLTWGCVIVLGFLSLLPAEDIVSTLRPRPARPSGSCQDNAGNHTSHPTGWAHDATRRDAGGVGQRYAARYGSSYSIIVARVNAAVRSDIACKCASTGLRKPTRPTMRREPSSRAEQSDEPRSVSTSRDCDGQVPGDQRSGTCSANVQSIMTGRYRARGHCCSPRRWRSGPHRQTPSGYRRDPASINA